MYRSSVAFLALLFVVVACSGNGATLTPASSSEKPASVGPIVVAADGPNIIPILVSAETVQGPDRFLFGLTDRKGLRAAAPDVTVRLSFFDDEADPEQVVFEAETRFIWAIEGWNGLYAADVSFPHAGRWATRFDVTLPDGTRESARVRFDVRETTSTPMIGAPAPRVDTPTAADVGGQLRLITTDPEPEPSMYEISVASALDAGEPFVVTFSTPAFCRSATCGPTLEVVKGVAAAYPDMRFIHVEPYVLEMDAGSLQPVLSEAGSLQDTAAVEAWGLLTEPFVAVVDGEGLVRAKFEGTVSAAELEVVIASLRPPGEAPKN